ncbi:hypothetical protein [Oryza sativa Japonica Group]|uniref:Uncharacterized protein P0702H08.29 n=1 Tax=Oryza sativa subsp. japonica TaxID=39947 RepID=Q5JM40_ORYSJ|nr:hypothetical protein [Oryza sativa Japonica Group]
MGELKRALDTRGHALLEMPMGTGKMVLSSSYARGRRRAPPPRADDSELLTRAGTAGSSSLSARVGSRC